MHLRLVSKAQSRVVTRACPDLRDDPRAPRLNVRREFLTVPLRGVEIINLDGGDEPHRKAQ